MSFTWVGASLHLFVYSFVPPTFLFISRYLFLLSLLRRLFSVDGWPCHLDLHVSPSSAVIYSSHSKAFSKLHCNMESSSVLLECLKKRKRAMIGVF